MNENKYIASIKPVFEKTVTLRSLFENGQLSKHSLTAAQALFHTLALSEKMKEHSFSLKDFIKK